MSRVTVFLSLGTGDQCRLLAAAALLLALSVALVVAPFSRLRDALLSVCDVAARIVPGSPTPGQITRAVDLADRHLPGERTCLMRSMTAEALLRAYRYEPTHRIGVDKEEAGGVEAHSWLEYDGEVLIGNLPDLSRYDSLPPLERGGAL